MKSGRGKNTGGMKKGRTAAECPVFAWQLLTLNELRFSYKIAEKLFLCVYDPYLRPRNQKRRSGGPYFQAIIAILAELNSL